MISRPETGNLLKQVENQVPTRETTAGQLHLPGARNMGAGAPLRPGLVARERGARGSYPSVASSPSSHAVLRRPDPHPGPLPPARNAAGRGRGCRTPALSGARAPPCNAYSTLVTSSQSPFSALASSMASCEPSTTTYPGALAASSTSPKARKSSAVVERT